MSWPVMMLSEVCEVIMGSAPAGSTYVDLHKGTPLIAGAADYGDLYPSPKKATSAPTKVTESGDIIICVRATIGDLNWADKEYCLGRGVAGLRVDYETLDAKYLWYFIKSYEPELYRQSTGSTFPQINRGVIESIPIPLPPLATQKQIAAILEKADQLRKDCQQMEQELNNLAQSVFMDMFGSMELNCRLEEHIDFLTSGSRGWAKYYSDSGSRFIRSLDVQMNYIGNADVAYVSAPDGREAERTRVAPGDVLLTITGSRIGRVAWVPVDFDEAYISQHVALLRLKETLIPQFLSYFLSLPVLGQRQIAKSQYGQTKPGLKLDHIKEFVLPRLTVNQQQCFVDFMSKQEELLKYAKLQLLEADIGFDSIIRKAFSGKLNLKNKAA